MHNLAQTKEGEWMTAWAGATPWHKLGTQAQGLMTTTEALEKAHLDWRVVKEPLYYEDNDEMEVLPATYGVFRTEDGKRIPLTKNGKAVGKVWKALQNVDAFAFLDELSGDHKPKVEVCGALGEGQTVWILARLPTSIVFDGVDTVHKYILITNTHDGTGSVRILPTPIRVVCFNTLSMALRQGAGQGYAIRHTGKMHERMEEALQAMKNVEEDFSSWANDVERMLETKITLDDAQEYFIDVMQLKRDEDGELATRGKNIIHNTNILLMSPTNNVGRMGGTVWAAYNAITEAIDHSLTQLRNGETSIKRTQSAMFGPLARRKVIAWNKAMELLA